VETEVSGSLLSQVKLNKGITTATVVITPAAAVSLSEFRSDRID
jgi:hypothetical protein